MYKVGDVVVKNNCVVCKIVGEEEKQIAPGMPKEKYFLLKSLDEKLTVHQPVKSAEKLLKPLMSKKEAEAFIVKLSKLDYDWNNDDKKRIPELKKEAETNSSVEGLGLIVGGYYKRMANDKHISRADQNFLDGVESKLFPAIGVSLECDEDGVREKFHSVFGI